MPVPYTFGTATSSIPLSQLDSNFATAITIGNTAVQLGNTVTTLNNLTLANVTISSGNVTITNVAVTTANVSGTANVSTMVVIGNETIGGNSTVSGNTSVTGNVSANNATLTTSLTLSGGTANGVAYLNTSKALTTGSAITFDGTNFATTGTASATKLIPTGGSATGNGMYLPASNQVAFSTNGTEAVRVDASQNVGIGTASPTQKLDVNGNINITNANSNRIAFGAGDTFTPSGGNVTAAYGMTVGGFVTNSISLSGYNGIAFYSSNTERMRLDSSGNVGIGTSSPAQKLHIQQTSAAASLTQLVLQNADNTAGTGSAIGFANHTSSGLLTGKLESAIDGANAYSLRFYTYQSGLNERMRIDTSGNVIVGGTSTSSNEATYQGGGVFTSRRASSAGTTHANFLNGGSTVGSITSNTTTTFYNTTSDYRLKENATPVTTGLQTIAALKPVNFDWVSNRIADTGFLAHEFQAVIPNCVMGTKDAIDANGNPVYQQIDRSGAIPFLVAAIQEQQALITALTARITALENK